MFPKQISRDGVITAGCNSVTGKTTCMTTNTLDSTLDNKTNAQVVQSILKTESPDGNYRPVESFTSGLLSTDQVKIVPKRGNVINLGTFTHVANRSVFILIPAGGTAAVNDSILELGSGLFSGAAGIALSPRSDYAGPFKSVDFTITAQFADLTAGGYIQRIGLSGVHNALQLGYDFNGRWGLYLPRGGKAHIVKLTMTVPASGIETATVTLNGVAYSVPLTDALGDMNFTAYQTFIGVFGFNLWFVDVDLNIVTWIGVIEGPRTGVYSFSSTGTAAGTFATRTIGIVKTDVWVYEDDFNVNHQFSISVDKTVKNIYDIEYTDVGGPQAVISIYDESIGMYRPVHNVHPSDVPGVWIAPMPLQYESINIFGIPVSKVLKHFNTASFITDKWEFSANISVSTALDKAITPGITSVIFGTRNRFEINGLRNYAPMIVQSISLAADGIKTVKFNLAATISETALGTNIPTDYPEWHVNPTFFTDDFTIGQTTNQNKLSTVDTSLVFLGEDIFLEKSESFRTDLPPNKYWSSSGLIILALAFGNNASDVSCAVNYIELL